MFKFLQKNSAKSAQKRAKLAEEAKLALAEKDIEGIDPVTYHRRWWILGTLCLTLLGVMLANSSLNMALPMMAKDLSLGQLELTWVVNVYTLVFASLLFIAGAVGDRYGRKLAMQIGLAVFTAGSLYAGFLAQTGTELIISRIVMGIGASFVMPTTLSIINNTFPKKERARAVAIWGAIAGVGMMFGSVISGILLEHFSWHSLFYFSAIIAIIGLVANQYLAHESKDEKESPVDWLGGLFSATGIFGFVYGITEAPSAGITDPLVLWSLIGGSISIVLFVLWEFRAKSPMLDMALFKNRAFSVSSLTLTLVFLAMSGVFFSMSQLMQLVMGYSALESSLLTIPLMLPMMFISPLVPSVVKKVGARTTITVGLVLVAVAFLAMATWTKDLTYWHLFFTMLVMMLGITFAMTPGTNILMASVPRNRSGMGSAMNDTTRELGSALGVAVLGAVLSAAYEKNVAEAASQFGGSVQEAIESSLAVAMTVAEKLGPASQSVIDAAMDAFMTGVSHAAIVASIIIFISAGIALFGLPKHAHKDDDTI
jgi:EmrB/QacA subfamily drug resistance transporter